MVSSINENGTKNMHQMMADLIKKMNEANTDGKKGLSKDELASIDTSNDKFGTNFITKLSENFNKIDANKDGQLTAEEMAPPKTNHGYKKGQMGPPPGLHIGELFKNSDSDGVAGLSKDEIAAIDTKDNQQKSKLVSKISENFDKIDTNSDGQITTDELKAFKAKEEAEKTKTTTEAKETDKTSSFVQIAEGFIKQLISLYQLSTNATQPTSTVDSKV